MPAADEDADAGSRAGGEGNNRVGEPEPGSDSPPRRTWLCPRPLELLDPDSAELGRLLSVRGRRDLVPVEEGNSPIAPGIDATPAPPAGDADPEDVDSSGGFDGSGGSAGGEPAGAEPVASESDAEDEREPDSPEESEDPGNSPLAELVPLDEPGLFDEPEPSGSELSDEFGVGAVPSLVCWAGAVGSWLARS